MIHKTELLDPGALSDRSEYERRVIDGAQNAGHGPKHINTDNSGRYHAGALQQVVIPGAIMAAELDAPGCCSDISDGKADLCECIGTEERD